MSGTSVVHPGDPVPEVTEQELSLLNFANGCLKTSCSLGLVHFSQAPLPCLLVSLSLSLSPSLSPHTHHTRCLLIMTFPGISSRQDV